MSSYFIVSVDIKEKEDRELYDQYIERVKPVVESFGGEYLVRTEDVVPLSKEWTPDRVIVIRFPKREVLLDCFASQKYKDIKDLRIQSVTANAVIVDGQ